MRIHERQKFRDFLVLDLLDMLDRTQLMKILFDWGVKHDEMYRKTKKQLISTVMCFTDQCQCDGDEEDWKHCCGVLNGYIDSSAP